MRGFDAVYLHYPFYGGAEPAVLAARALRIPHVVYFHMDVTWDGWRGKVLEAYSRTAAPVVLRSASAVLAHSIDYVEHSSAARLRLSNLRERPLGIDTDFYSPGHVSKERRSELGFDADRPAILFVGAMDVDHHFKGVPKLIQAFAREGLADRAQLVLVGGGALRPTYEDEARRAGVLEHVRFTGTLLGQDLVDAYRAAEVAVLPSTTHAESFGLVMVEAMAAARPVVASDWPGVRTVVNEEQGGVRVPPGDVSALANVLAQLLADPERRARMGARAREVAVAKYSHEVEREHLASDFAALDVQRARRARADQQVD
jgi:glycosyltransferase involved in cell wall biosynthesis